MYFYNRMNQNSNCPWIGYKKTNYIINILKLLNFSFNPLDFKENIQNRWEQESLERKLKDRKLIGR